MKIALLTDSDVFAGTERHMLDLAVGLRVLGAEPTLVCPATGILAQRGHTEELPVFSLEKRLPIDPGLVGRLARQWRGGTFDVMHAHNGRMAIHATLAKAGSRRGALVATQHFLTPARAGRSGVTGSVGRAVHGLAERGIQRHIAISHAVGDAMLARHETIPEKLRVVHNGIRDPRRLPLAPREQTRAQLGVPEAAPLIVCLARLEPEKGLPTLIDAMALVARRLPDAVCLVAGRGSISSILQQQITGMQPVPPVRLLGFVEDTLSLLAASDLCVLPSVAEPFGLSLVEAMALGIPVISTRAGGPMEIVREGVTGHLTPPGETRALAEAMLDLLTNDARRASMGLAAREDFSPVSPLNAWRGKSWRFTAKPQPGFELTGGSAIRRICSSWVSAHLHPPLSRRQASKNCPEMHFFGSRFSTL